MRYKRAELEQAILDVIAERDRLQSQLDRWVNWARENEAALNTCITLAQIHGCPYKGEPWPMYDDFA